MLTPEVSLELLEAGASRGPLPPRRGVRGLVPAGQASGDVELNRFQEGHAREGPMVPKEVLPPVGTDPSAGRLVDALSEGFARFGMTLWVDPLAPFHAPTLGVPAKLPDLAQGVTEAHGPAPYPSQGEGRHPESRHGCAYYALSCQPNHPHIPRSVVPVSPHLPVRETNLGVAAKTLSRRPYSLRGAAAVPALRARPVADDHRVLRAVRIDLQPEGASGGVLAAARAVTGGEGPSVPNGASPSSSSSVIWMVP